MIFLCAHHLVDQRLDRVRGGLVRHVQVVEYLDEATELAFLLDEVHREAHLRHRQRRGHAAYSSADDERDWLHVDLDLLLGDEQARPRDPHPDEVLGLLRGQVLLLHVDPGAVLPDVHECEQVLVQPGPLAGGLEQGRVGPGRAAGDYDPVEVVLPYGLPDAAEAVLGTGVQVVGRERDVGEGLGILRDGRHIDEPADVRAAVADEHSDPWLLRLVMGGHRIILLRPGRLPRQPWPPRSSPERRSPVCPPVLRSIRPGICRARWWSLAPVSCRRSPGIRTRRP